MKSWFEVVVRARLRPEEKDDKEILVLGRIVKVEDWVSPTRRIRDVGGSSWRVSGWQRDPRASR